MKTLKKTVITASIIAGIAFAGMTNANASSKHPSEVNQVFGQKPMTTYELYQAYLHNKPGDINSAMSLKDSLAKLADYYAKTGDPHAFAPVVSDTGVVTYPYGNVYPIVSVSPLHATIIQLEEGETINSYALGNNSDFHVQTSSYANRPVLVVKPTRAGVSTNLTVLTSKRIYTINLYSTVNQFTPVVGFYYPDEILTVVHQEKVTADKKQAEQAEATVAYNLNPENMDFNYKSTVTESKDDNAVVQPVRVFNDGQKTYIQMPGGQWPAPSVMALVNGQYALTNNKWHKPYYIIDGVPPVIRLLYSDKDYVDIKRVTAPVVQKESHWWESKSDSSSSKDCSNPFLHPGCQW